MTPTIRTPIVLGLALLMLAPGAGAQDAKPDPNLARLIQTVEGFNRPESCAVGAGGRVLYVTNSAATPDGMPLGRGAISALEILEDGTLKMLKADFVTGLNSPMGIAVLPKSTKKFRAGSLFVCTGFNHAVDDKGRRIKDVKRLNPGVTVIDHETGKVLGHIAMGPGTAAAKNLIHPTLQPDGLCFDTDGNLFIADGGGGGDDLEPPARGRPGVKRFKHADIDPYSDDKAGGELMFVNVRHVPAGVYYSKADDFIYWTTSDGDGPAGGAVYRLPRKDFPQQSSVANVVGALNPLDGLCITPGDSLLASRLHDGDIALVTRKQLGVLRFVGHDEDFKLAGPADIKLHTLASGHNILYVPEREPDAKEPWKQRLRVVLLPGRL